ncbi:MAG: CopG family transcriptional regulator [Nitrospira bacterium SG8_35_4]|nr:MAG: CopG family transcriptional regulator [Nitrospira bacterium SG8_35_4]
MSKTKIAITLDEDFIAEIDHLIKEHKFMNRSQAIQEAVKDKLQRLKKSRLAEECSKLDSSFEKSMAEEGISEDLSEWPEY